MRPTAGPTPQRAGNAKQYHAQFHRAKDRGVAHDLARTAPVDPPRRPTSTRRPSIVGEVSHALIIIDMVSSNDDSHMKFVSSTLDNRQATLNESTTDYVPLSRLVV